MADLTLPATSPAPFRSRRFGPSPGFIALCLLLSLLAHWVFIVTARMVASGMGGNDYRAKIAPARRLATLERAEIDPKLLEPEKAPEMIPARPPAKSEFDVKRLEAAMNNPAATEATIPLDNVRMTPQAHTIENALREAAAPPRPAKGGGVEQAMADAQRQATARMDAELDNSLKNELLAAPAAVPGQSSLNLTPGDAPPSNGLTNGAENGSGAEPGYSDLDSLLGQTGPLPGNTAPILMPGDVLFDFDRFDLQEFAVTDLRKLGQLIQRNPQLVFIIEGHTDSIGDATHNLRLSESRALSVKQWLMQNMAIPADRIRTVGYGSTRPIVPITGDRDQEQRNRRVEILIQTPR